MNRTYSWVTTLSTVLSTVLTLTTIGQPANAADALAVLHAPYWRLGDGVQTTIMMNNTRPKTTTVTPYVYNDKGESLPATPLTIGPMGTKSVLLSDILTSRINQGNGYLELRYSGTPVDIAAQALIQDQTRGMRWNHVFESKKTYLSSRYEGVFMGGGDLAGATLVVTNASSAIAVVAFTAIEGGTPHRETFQLPAHNQRLIALGSYLTGPAPPGRRSVGISISHGGAPGDVILQGLASLGGDSSYNIHMFDSGRLQSPSLFSPVLVLPWAHNPFLALRNTATTHSMISMTAHYNLASGQKPQEAELQKIDLAPGASTVVAFKGLLGTLPTGARDIGLEVTTSDDQGHLISGSTVTDLVLLADEGGQVIQLTPKDPAGHSFPGFSQPWDISGNNKTVIAVTNPSKTNQVGLMLGLHYDGGRYSYPSAMLAPGETRHISVNEIRDSQVAGPEGQKLPKSIGSGQALISVPGPHEALLAQTVVSDPTQAVALTSSCSTCPPSASYYSVSPSGVVDGLVGDQITVTPYCHLDDGTQYQVLNPNAIDWSSGDSSIASVTWSGSTAYLNFNSYGSTTIDSTSHDCVYQYNFDTGECDCTVTALPVQFQIQPRTRQPQWVAVTYDSNGSYPFCPGNVLRDRGYRALDGFGWVDNQLHWVLNETITSQSGCGSIVTGSNVNANGFEDQISIGCNSSSCVFQTDQTFSVGRPNGAVTLVSGKNCVGISDSATCRAQPTHSGWHVSASASSVTVTDIP